jgi:hypothetical protein
MYRHIGQTNGQRARLYDIVGRLQDFALLASTEIMPNIEDLESRGLVSMGFRNCQE